MENQIYVVEEDAQKAFSRFGFLNIPNRTFLMPAISPGIQSALDATALIENMRGGLFPQVITPYLSTRQRYLPIIGQITDNRSYEEFSGKVVTRPFIVPDPEYEALSINCTARLNYFGMDNPPQSVSMLMESGLTEDLSKNRYNVTSRWNSVRRKYGLAPLMNWTLDLHSSVNSDAYLAPMPIMRADERLKSIKEAFTCGYYILSNAIAEARFPINGIHMFLHNEIFSDDELSQDARNAIISEIGTWSTSKSQLKGTLVSFKILDPNNQLGEPDSGSTRRRILSEFITDLSQKVRDANGALIGQNFANLCLGIIDSGADISTFKMSGTMRIDMPIKGKPGRRGKLKIPSFFDMGTLTETDHDRVKSLYNANGSFPVPSCVTPEPYWEMNYKPSSIYARRLRCGLVELGDEYRDAGLNKTIPLKEAIRNRILQSEVRQELMDLCPSWEL